MGKVIGGAIAGYVLMAVTVFVLFAVAYLVFGTSGVFQPGSWDPSAAWIVLSIIVGVVAGTAGGFLCALIAKDPKGTKTLVGIVIVMGVLVAMPVLTGSAEVVTTPRPNTVSMFDAMSNARQPGWMVLLNPILGVVGVVLGARLYKRRPSS